MSDTLLDWQAAALPTALTLTGRFIRLEKLDAARHADDLWAALEGPNADPQLWDYLPYGPFSDRGAFGAWLVGHQAATDPWFYTVVDQQTNKAEGVISLMSIVAAHGRIEIGHVTFGAAMQRTPKGTEAIYLLAREIFALGYRRLEWKCNANNARSKRAAERFGFSYEGTFRQHMVVKGQSRDTAWYSILDSEWPERQNAFERWLAVDNFKNGQQIKGLEAFR
ncbi:GNAT family N-acetyltransferase [Pseudomonas fragariae (ex Marin et al. 2024)]|uniref:GNAT family acetyltransferase n=1 Tax=Pseudomonas syringae pv. solidagae TaxID=264458 RepID=A0A0Q0EQS8_PSESX|nr:MULTISPECIES: GNAT family protein [Pseudomonas]KPY53945.1 GNAT family acetyltransferase [Pseudomonas syringae pv. solidagae]KTB79401.1 GNAT family acetyltransferase [Pseudomonas syringae ICMP 13102]MCH5550849.1 GNAT family N-acetyltransferase [Pseudomonas syringae pv. syringae]PBP91322.1 N-acetyltransferase [Pseudomonas syringae]RMT28895.1 GNAT family acetyltransferase [Pseudomonas syringae pv. solidagae]